MDGEEVRIVTMQPLHVASVLGFGTEPESEAWGKLRAWAGARGYLKHPGEHRIFGFNNPSPSPGSPNYGYELWITIGQDVAPGSEVEVKDFPGGTYAVTRCPMCGDPSRTIPAAWKKLLIWREESRYGPAQHQWLEEHFHTDRPEEEWELDLYLPITE